MILQFFSSFWFYFFTPTKNNNNNDNDDDENNDEEENSLLALSNVIKVNKNNNGIKRLSILRRSYSELSTSVSVKSIVFLW